jgi:autotransporter-associated beta strand protein
MKTPQNHPLVWEKKLKIFLARFIHQVAHSFRGLLATRAAILLLWSSVILVCPAANGQNNGMFYQIPTSEYDALVDLYNVAGGDDWTCNSGWLDPDAASWCGVDVNGVEYDTNGNVVVQGNVEEVFLDFNQLSGSIPESLGNLFQLQYLYLADNQLSGSIPESLGNLSQLQILWLSANQLSGSIPESLGNLSQLQGVGLDGNQLSGSIPESLGNLSQLQGFGLDHNQLSGSMPESLGSLFQLKYLYLADNQLSGSIPESLGNLSQLKYLYLADNQLSGSIPESLGNLSQLQELYLTDNQLSGSIPESLGNLAQLQELYLYDNCLTYDSGSANLLLMEALQQEGIDVVYGGYSSACSPGQVYWDPGLENAFPGSGATGTWDNSTVNWWFSGTGDIPWSTGDYANFDGTAGTVTLGADVTAGGLAFGTDGYVITGSETLTLNSPGTISVSTDISASIDCVLDGVGYSLSGGGTLMLNNLQNSCGSSISPASVTGPDTTLEVYAYDAVGQEGVTLTLTNGGIYQDDDIINGNQFLPPGSTIALLSGGGVLSNPNADLTMSGFITGSGSLTLSGTTHTLTLAIGNTFTGKTIIEEGTLSLESTGSINSSGISIAAGATFDVSGIASYVSSGNTLVFSASGNGTVPGDTAAVIKGASDGTVNIVSPQITLTFAPTSFEGDTLHPSLYISQGTLSLFGNHFVVSNASDTQLGVGTYTLIQQASRSITSSEIYPENVVVIGKGIADRTTESIEVSFGRVYLIVSQEQQTTTSVTATRQGITVPVFTPFNLSGQVLGHDPIYPTNGEIIAVTIDGNTQTTTINDSTGDFSFNYNPSTIPASTTPYIITYSYAGDALLNPATNTNTTLTVTAPAPPAIQTAKQSGNLFTFTWSTIANQMYEVQSTTNLALTNWSTLGGTITATNSTMTISEPIGADSQQFYRVALLP